MVSFTIYPAIKQCLFYRVLSTQPLNIHTVSTAAVRTNVDFSVQCEIVSLCFPHTIMLSTILWRRQQIPYTRQLSNETTPSGKKIKENMISNFRRKKKEQTPKFYDNNNNNNENGKNTTLKTTYSSMVTQKRSLCKMEEVCRKSSTLEFVWQNALHSSIYMCDKLNNSNSSRHVAGIVARTESENDCYCKLMKRFHYLDTTE